MHCNIEGLASKWASDEIIDRIILLASLIAVVVVVVYVIE